MRWNNKLVIIGGLPNSGKTYLAKQIAKQHNKVMVYTPHPNEWKNMKVTVYHPKNQKLEFPVFVKAVKKLNKKKGVDCMIIDDCEPIFETHFDTNPTLRELVVNRRHLGLTCIGIARRPQDIPTQIYSQYDILCMFRLESPQTFDLLRKIHQDFPKDVKRLNEGSHRFVLKVVGKEPRITKV